MRSSPNQMQLELLDEEMGTRLAGLRNVPAPELRPAVLEKLDLADRYFKLDTVAGDVYISYNSRGISFIERVQDITDFEADFRRQFARPTFETSNPRASLVRQIEATLHGQSRTRPPFDLSSVTEFHRAVLLKALEIPYGQVRPYTWIASEIGRPKAQRAVGSALAGNPIPLLIPCHRVVRSDGIIGNYGMGGPAVKRKILEAEGANPQSLETFSRSGFRFIGSDTTQIYCFPTCGHGRHITDRHVVRFVSAEQAKQLGYRACKVCRPQS